MEGCILWKCIAVSTSEWWNNGYVVCEHEGHSNFKTENMELSPIAKTSSSFSSWDEPMSTIHETTCCASGVWFFITSLFRCVHRPCRLACSKMMHPPPYTHLKNLLNTWHKLLKQHTCMCVLNPEGRQHSMLGHDLTMQTLHLVSISISNPRLEMNSFLMWDKSQFPLSISLSQRYTCDHNQDGNPTLML